MCQINTTFLTNRKHTSHKSRVQQREPCRWEGVSAHGFGWLLPSGCLKEVLTLDINTAYLIQSEPGWGSKVCLHYKTACLWEINT